jgi:hypothetical protein
VEKAEEPRPVPAPVPKSKPKPPTVVAKAESPSALSDKIQALLDQQKPTQQAPEPDSARGVRDGRAGAAMTLSEIDAFKQRIQSCWRAPPGATSAEELRTEVRIRLNRDGSLLGTPQIVARPPGRYQTTAPESVVRAILVCAPYDLPTEKYAEWQEIEFVFYPVDMF